MIQKENLYKITLTETELDLCRILLCNYNKENIQEQYLPTIKTVLDKIYFVGKDFFKTEYRI